jgi:GT2 family glycosyltransferase
LAKSGELITQESARSDKFRPTQYQNKGHTPKNFYPIHFVTPIVTILTTVYNGEEFIVECVNSILSQTFENFEYIILNNGSTDGTADILNKLTDPRLQIIHQENLGISRSLNKGAQLSRCDLIARLDADDYSSPTRLERQVETMNKYPGLVLCGSRFRELTGNKESEQRVPYTETDQAIRKAMSLFNPFAHSTVIFRKKTFNEAGGYNNKFKYGQDYDLWLRMLSLGEACILKDELCTLRVSEQSSSYQNKRAQKLEGLIIRWKAFRQLGGNPSKNLYYLLKSLVGLVFPSTRNFK